MSIDSDLEAFRKALATNASAYDVELTDKAIQRISDYYELLLRWNPRLHLVAPTSPEEFATRHILESLILLRHLPRDARVADVGSGGGLPILPCLTVRDDLNAILIEASQKKSVFLQEATKGTGTTQQARVIAERFENLETPDVAFVTSRALERFEAMLPRLIEWAPQQSQLLLFGGPNLEKRFQASRLSFDKVSIPKSNQRLLFVVSKA